MEEPLIELVADKSVLKIKLEEDDNQPGGFDFYSLLGFEEVTPLLTQHPSKLSEEENLVVSMVNGWAQQDLDVLSWEQWDRYSKSYLSWKTKWRNLKGEHISRSFQYFKEKWKEILFKDLSKDPKKKGRKPKKEAKQNVSWNNPNQGQTMAVTKITPTPISPSSWGFSHGTLED